MTQLLLDRIIRREFAILKTHALPKSKTTNAVLQTLKKVECELQKDLPLIIESKSKTDCISQETEVIGTVRRWIYDYLKIELSSQKNKFDYFTSLANGNSTWGFLGFIALSYLIKNFWSICLLLIISCGLFFYFQRRIYLIRRGLKECITYCEVNYDCLDT
ncbi:hypothetical protein [Myxosarcina sp. GI1]|uniref:hypothetical protein n=1 Tax=Myxosarcina sp. GI1 TaxID=1541065 RepID=UPI00056183F2|nr:hypothetical protein [Myxosarcina sp. GI1]